MKKIINFAHELIEEVTNDSDTVIDATAGNGHDTLFLSQLTPKGKTYAFDIQAEAVNITKNRLLENKISNVSVIEDSHANLYKYISTDTPIAAAIFNLGYLPKGDKEIITKPDSTIEAVDQIIERLQIGGRVVIVVYAGHEGGALEKAALINYVQNLPQVKFEVLRYEFINHINTPPFIIAIEKRKVGKTK